MKRKILSLFVFLLAGGASAQDFINIIDISNSNVVNGTEISVTGNATDLDIYKYFKIKVNGIFSVDVNLRRTELDVQTGTKNSTCLYLCPTDVDAGLYPVWDYGNPPTGAPMIPALTLTPPDTADNFQLHHRPQGLNGCSLYRYVIYDINNPSDTAYVDVRFIHTTNGQCNLGIENENNIKVDIVLYPNPASDQVTLKFDQNTDITEVVIVDMLGKIIKRITISGKEENVKFDVSDINEGLYFYQALVGSKKVASKKFVVNR